MKVKAISVGIFESKSIGNCSNHGISERLKDILLICDRGNSYEVDEDDERLCRVDSVSYGGKTHYFVRPVAEPKGVGWMFGGSLVYSSDARFPFEYPLALHDRCESQELYDMLSH